MIKQADMAVIL